jgi:hypothetical protein
VAFADFEMFLNGVDKLDAEKEILQGMRKKRRNELLKDYNKAIVYKTDDKKLSLDSFSLENFKQTPKPFRSPYKLKQIIKEFPE